MTPTAPGPGATFNEGSDCTLQYTLDVRLPSILPHA